MIIRRARRQDVPEIVQLLSNDILGQKRENFTGSLREKYYQAFDRIDKDPQQELIVAENERAEVIATFQLSFIQSMTYQGGIRALIEAVRVRHDLRGQGIGDQLMRWAMARAKERNAHMLQLTTDKSRPDAHRFYERLGFKATHEGMKLHL